MLLAIIELIQQSYVMVMIGIAGVNNNLYNFWVNVR
jgi:hypothetical protein